MKHLYFCRHGESELNVRQIYAGVIDTPLTDRGREQAQAAGSQAAGLNIDLIVTSPLQRTLETAQIIAAKLHYPPDRIITNELFLEISFGSLAGQPFSVAPDRAVYPDIETDASLQARAEAALEYLEGLDAENILVVGHGTFALALCKPVGYETNGQELPNAEIVCLI